LDNRDNCGGWNYLVYHDKKEKGRTLAKKTRRTNTASATRNTNSLNQDQVGRIGRKGKIEEIKLEEQRSEKRLEKIVNQ